MMCWYAEYLDGLRNVGFVKPHLFNAGKGDGISEGREGGNAQMGAKKKKGTVAHCPESLRTPITITFDQLVAKMLIDHGKQDYEPSDDLRAAWIELNRDIQQRMCDAATSCGFDVGTMPLLLKLLQLDPRPMLELFACKFPRAFRLQLDGTKKKPRKNGGRGVQNKMQLMELSINSSVVA